MIIAAFVLLTATASQALARFSALIVDAESGETLYSANADAPRYPASLTKMMTLYMLFEAIEQGRVGLHDSVEVSSRAAAQPPSKLGIRAGGQLTVEDAILALVTKSANDIAVAVGEHLGGSEWRFAQAMTARARQLGMADTTFQNASGLPDPDQVTTARDMAILARALVNDFPQHYHYFGTRAFYYRGAAHRNHNRMLFDYSGVDGIKTGFIRASGFNLVASAQRGGRRLIGVVFGAHSPGQRGRIMASLLDNGFGNVPADGYASDIVTAATSGMREPDRGDTDRRSAAMASGAATVVLGTYSDSGSASTAARAAQRTLPHLLGDGDVEVTTIAGRGRKSATRYQARIVDLTRNDALAACQALNKRSRSGCRAIVAAKAAVPSVSTRRIKRTSAAAQQAAAILAPSRPAKVSVKLSASAANKSVQRSAGKSRQKVVAVSSPKGKARSTKRLSAANERSKVYASKSSASTAAAAPRTPNREQAQAGCSSRRGHDDPCPMVR